MKIPKWVEDWSSLLERIHWPLPLSENLIARYPIEEPLPMKAERSSRYTMRPDEPRKEDRPALLEALKPEKVEMGGGQALKVPLKKMG
jgi:hypothetical protein